MKWLHVKKSPDVGIKCHPAELGRSLCLDSCVKHINSTVQVGGFPMND